MASSLPAWNATLNAASAVMLVCGYVSIRREARRAHKVCMLGACFFSLLFLICYVIYHLEHGSTSFTGQGWIRPVYFFILITHILLAAAMLPLVLLTLARALLGQFDKHKRIARVTLPIWFYVSVTGVIIYWLLYHVFAT